MAQNLRGKISSSGSLHGTLTGLEKIVGYSAYQVAVINGFEGTEEAWLASLKGEQGIQGEPGKVVFEELTEEEREMLKGNDGAPGKDGVPATHKWSGTTLTITSASGTSSADLKGDKGDTGNDGYTPRKNVDFFDGKDGKDGYTPVKGKDYFDGADGKDGYTPVKGKDYFDGEDGVSPTLSVTDISGGHRLTITDAKGTKTVDIMDGDAGSDGVDGFSPVLSVTEITGGHRITITDAAGRKTVDIMDGATGQTGAAGKDGSDGVDGRGIQKIERTSGNGAAGSSDTYTITYTDNTTSRFTVYNGADGTSFVVKDRYATLAALKAAHATGSEGDAYAVGTESENTIYIWGVDTRDWTPIGSLQGPQGVAGEDGRAAEFRSSGNYLQWRLVGDASWTNLLPLSSITGPTGATGNPGATGQDGVSPVVSVSTINGGHRISITDANGMKTFDVMDGSTGATGSDGNPGADGEDGISPVVSVSTITGGHRLTITDANGTKTVNIMDGADGQAGASGSDGYTPRKGVDYFTEADKEELVASVLAALPAAEEATF